MSKWEKVKLGNYIHEYSERNKDNVDIPVYSVTNSNGFCSEYFSKEIASKDKSTYKIVKKGFFAYNPSRINVGSIDWLRKENAVIVSPLYNVFSVDAGLDQQYLYYYLKSPVGLYYIKELASGSVRDNLKLSTLREFSIPLPPIYIQCRIANTLDKLNNTIGLCNSILEKLDLLVKSQFVEMFGDPQRNTMGYDKKMLKETCTIVTGNTPPRANAEYYGDYIEWIKTDNIISDMIIPTRAVVCLSEKGMKIGRTVEKDSILMACIAGSVASIGKVCVTDRKVSFNQQINAIVPKQYDTLFLYILLQMSKEYLVKDINMALKGILSKSKLEEKEFFIPPMEKQSEYAKFVQQVDKSKLAVKKTLEKAETLKKALMQEYFG